MKRKGIKRLVLGIVAVISVVMLAVLPMIAKRNGTAYGPRMTILRGVADSGDIVTGIHGGGVLMVQTPEKITVPASVKLTKFLVENGETVCAGDPIAQVDSVTIMAAIADTQQNLDQLTQQIQTIPKDSGTVKLKAPTGGIIKAIYARKGQSVQDVILGHGSLAVLSLGGRMTVKVDTELVIPAGSAVSVRFENGTAVDATVESCLEGCLQVSFEDKGYDLGTSVWLQSAEGDFLGSGKLEIRDPLILLVSDGIIDRVAVSEGQWVDTDDVILELKEAGASSQYRHLLSVRQEQETLLHNLIALHCSGVVTAPCEGVINGADENCIALLNPEQENGEIVPDSLKKEYLSSLAKENNIQNTDILIASVTPQQWMTVSITVDEQDVLCLRPGMEATVRVPAIPDQTLTAIISEIGAEGRNHGGSSKYSVKLTLPYEMGMLAGMNVTVNIPVEHAENVNRIPVAAVVDLGTKTVVYRGYDSKKEMLIDPVEVSLGRSDGVFVELLSGLAPGDVYYYGYYDTLPLTDEPDFGILPFGRFAE